MIYKAEETMKTVPESELKEDFARSGGKGGQKVNKTSSKAIITWDFGKSSAFTVEEKELIDEKLRNRINRDGLVVVSYEAERSQTQNRAGARRVLNELVNQAIRVDAERIQTKPTLGSVVRRIDSKEKHGRKKQDRKTNWHKEW